MCVTFTEEWHTLTFPLQAYKVVRVAVEEGRGTYLSGVPLVVRTSQAYGDRLGSSFDRSGIGEELSYSLGVEVSVEDPGIYLFEDLGDALDAAEGYSLFHTLGLKSPHEYRVLRVYIPEGTEIRRGKVWVTFNYTAVREVASLNAKRVIPMKEEVQPRKEFDHSAEFLKARNLYDV